MKRRIEVYENIDENTVRLKYIIDLDTGEVLKPEGLGTYHVVGHIEIWDSEEEEEE